MRTEILSAVIAALVSAVTSFLVSRSRSRSDLLARNRDLFGSQLIQRRLEHYPELYRVLSDFSKKLHRVPKGINVGPISIHEFRKTRDLVFAWDSRHSYLMSNKCIEKWGDYYRMLDSYCAKDEKVLAAELNNEKICEQISLDSAGIENALKSDLGVNDLEFLRVNTFFDNYGDALNALPRSSKKRLYSLIGKLIKRYPRYRRA